MERNFSIQFERPSDQAKSPFECRPIEFEFLTQILDHYRYAESHQIQKVQLAPLQTLYFGFEVDDQTSSPFDRYKSAETDLRGHYLLQCISQHSELLIFHLNLIASTQQMVRVINLNEYIQSGSVVMNMNTS